MDYEQRVTQPETTVPCLLEGLGEVWDERRLSFNELECTVKTASVWQVKETMSTRSIGRWKHYHSHFKDIFGDAINGQNKA